MNGTLPVVTRTAASLAACLLAAGCGVDTSAHPGNQGASGTPPTTVHAEYDVPPSLEALAREADVVLIASVGDVRETSEEAGGLVMAYVNVEVTEFLSGSDAVANARSVIVTVPAESTGFDAASRLSKGDNVVIFGEFIPAEGAPVSIPNEGLVAPLGGSVGILDLDGETLTARSKELVITLRDLDEIEVDANGQEIGHVHADLELDLSTLRELVGSAK